MLIGIAGMVGAGKTTLTEALSSRLGYSTEMESVGDHNPWLTPFYEEEDGMRRYGLQLQLHFLATRMESMRRIRAIGGGWLLDRTHFEDAEVFARGLHERGMMGERDWDLYQRLYTELCHSPAAQPPAVLLYLNGPLEEIHRRILLRGREAEKDTPIEYWAEIHGRYGRWIERFQACPVVELDITRYDIKACPEQIEEIVARIRPFLSAPAAPRLASQPVSASRVRVRA